MKKNLKYLSIVGLIILNNREKPIINNELKVKKWLEWELNSILSNYNKYNGFNLLEKIVYRKLPGVPKYLSSNNAWLSASNKNRENYIKIVRRHLVLNMAYILDKYSYKKYRLDNIRLLTNVILVDIYFSNNKKEDLVEAWIIETNGKFYIIDLIIRDRSFVLVKRYKFKEIFDIVDNNLEEFNSKLSYRNNLAYSRMSINSLNSMKSMIEEHLLLGKDVLDNSVVIDRKSKINNFLLEIKNINNIELIDQQKKGSLVIDIRRKEEWIKTGIIKESETITAYTIRGEMLSEFKDEVLSLIKDTNKPIILYCKSGNRSKKLAKEMINNWGFSNVSHLTNGITGWKDSGNKTVVFK